MTAHRYWRLNCTAHNGGGGYRITEIEMRTSAGGADVCSGGTASASNSTIGFPPANAFDNNGITHWDRSAATAWIEYDFGLGNDKDIVEVAVVAANLPLKTPKDFAIQWSDDNASWTNLVSVTGITGWYAGQQRVFQSTGEVSGPSFAAACRFWRMLITADNGGSPRVAEMELRVSSGGADVTGSGTAINGPSTISGHDYSSAFDNDPVSYWSIGSGFSSWGTYDFGSGVTKAIIEIAVQADASTAATSAPKDFIIQRGDDGIRWATPNMSITGITGWSNGQTRYFDSTGEVFPSPPASSARRVVFVC